MSVLDRVCRLKTSSFKTKSSKNKRGQLLHRLPHSSHRTRIYDFPISGDLQTQPRPVSPPTDKIAEEVL